MQGIFHRWVTHAVPMLHAVNTKHSRQWISHCQLGDKTAQQPLLVETKTSTHSCEKEKISLRIVLRLLLLNPLSAKVS